MIKIAQKDLAAYRELVSRHLNRGLGVAERMLGNRQDAEDIMQEVCLKIWNGADKWKPTAKFSTWLYKILINSCIDKTRKIVPLSITNIDLLIDDSSSADENLINQQIAEKVKNALQKLPDRQRAAILLSYYEGMSNQNCADSMGVSLNAFQQLLFRGRESLKLELIEYKGGIKNEKSIKR